MARLLTPFLQAIDGNGAPISGALLYFYITGTSTPKDTFSQSDLDPSHVNANPVVADSAGRFGPIYLAQDVDYKAILKHSSGTTLETRDPLLTITTSVISHQGSLIVGNALGGDSEFLISSTNGARLASNGTTLEWRSPNMTVQKFLSGSGTYTTPANCTAIRGRLVAGGGGGGASGGSTGPNGATGSTSSFGTITVIGGTGGTGNAGSGIVGGGAGGTGGSGTVTARWSGQAGGAVSTLGGTGAIAGDGGGSSMYGGGGRSPVDSSNPTTGGAGKANTGGGGSGSISPGTVQPPGGGGGGESAEFLILAPSANYSYVVGAGGAGGVGTGTGAATGGAGGSGVLIVEEFYS